MGQREEKSFRMKNCRNLGAIEKGCIEELCPQGGARDLPERERFEVGRGNKDEGRNAGSTRSDHRGEKAPGWGEKRKTGDRDGSYPLIEARKERK